MRNALDPSWLLSAAMFRSTRSVPPTVSESGSCIVMNTCRPPRSDPAVSKIAPDSSASRFRNSAWSSFCSGV